MHMGLFGHGATCYPRWFKIIQFVMGLFCCLKKPCLKLKLFTACFGQSSSKPKDVENVVSSNSPETSEYRPSPQEFNSENDGDLVTGDENTAQAEIVVQPQVAEWELVLANLEEEKRKRLEEKENRAKIEEENRRRWRESLAAERRKKSLEVVDVLQKGIHRTNERCRKFNEWAELPD